MKNKLHKMIILLAVYLVSSPIPVRDETEKNSCNFFLFNYDVQLNYFKIKRYVS